MKAADQKQQHQQQNHEKKRKKINYFYCVFLSGVLLNIVGIFTIIYHGTFLNNNNNNDNNSYGNKNDSKDTYPYVEHETTASNHRHQHPTTTTTTITTATARDTVSSDNSNNDISNSVSITTSTYANNNNNNNNNKESQTQTQTNDNDNDSMLCVTPELDGRWVHDGTPKGVWKHRFIVDKICSTEHYDNVLIDPHTAALCGNQSMVEQLGTFHWGPPDHLVHMSGRAHCAHPRKEYLKFKEKFTWTFHDGQQQNNDTHFSFIPDSICLHLRNRTVLMVGDSTMQQASSTLMNAVFGKCQTQMAYALSDTLQGAFDFGSGWARGGPDPWTTHVQNIQPDIVVLTAGAHIYNEQLYKQLIITVIHQIKMIQQLLPSIIILWKTQSPAGCQIKPLLPDLTTKNPLEVFRDYDWDGRSRYNWEFFFPRDQWTIRQLQLNNIPFMDMRMLYARMEAHPFSVGIKVDCLHFCGPGPLDTFVQVFHRLLLRNFTVSQCLYHIDATPSSSFTKNITQNA